MFKINSKTPKNYYFIDEFSSVCSFKEELEFSRTFEKKDFKTITVIQYRKDLFPNQIISSYFDELEKYEKYNIYMLPPPYKTEDTNKY